MTIKINKISVLLHSFKKMLHFVLNNLLLNKKWLELICSTWSWLNGNDCTVHIQYIGSKGQEGSGGGGSRNLCRRDRAHGLCMTPLSGHTTGSCNKRISHSYISNLHLLSSSIWEEHPSHPSMCSSRLKSTFSNGWKEDEKRPLWCRWPLRNTGKCNQQWPMLDSTIQGVR